MRRLTLSLAAAILCLIGGTRDASATATVTLIWGACGGGTGCSVGIGGGVGTNIIWVAPGGGQTLRLDIFLTHNEPTGLNAHTFSINFDTDLGNELNFTGGMAPVEWSGTDTNPGPLTEVYGPFTAGTEGTVESTTGTTVGRINSFDSGTVLTTNLPRTGLAYTVGSFTATAPASYRVAQAFFTVTLGTVNDGLDVFSGAFHGLADVTTNGLNQVVTMNFLGASVNLGDAIPEPGSGALLGFGLLGLLLARRHRGR